MVMRYKYDSSGKVTCKPPSKGRQIKRHGDIEWLARMAEDMAIAKELGWGIGLNPKKPKAAKADPQPIFLDEALLHARKLADDMGPLQRRKLNKPPAVLYVVVTDSAPGVVKIGITNNLAKRVRAITTASGMRCVAAAAWRAREDVVRAAEDRVKRALRRRRTHGEWFRAPLQSFVRYVGMIVKSDGERVA